ncbi:MAG TPA: hypothetical protein VGC24_01175, partial [Burkholderiaceae bacterium]
DRLGALSAAIGVSICLTVVLGASFLAVMPPAVATPVFGVLLAAQLARSTVAQASAAQVAGTSDRMTFQCLAAAGTNLAQAAGAAVSALVLGNGLDGSLTGMGKLAATSVALSWLMLPFLAALRRRRAWHQGTAEVSIICADNEPVH